MPSRSDIEAGRAFLRLFLKDDMTRDLRKSLKAVGKELQDTGKQVMKIGAGITAAGASIVGSLAGAVGHFIKVGDDLGDMSARTGVAAGALAELGYAATQSGTDIGAVETSLVKMQKVIGEAIGGSKSARKAFRDLGLSLKDLRDIAPEDQFQAIADALAATDESQRLAKATDIFGKGAAEIMPMLADLRAFRDDARAEGIIPSEEAIAAAGDLDDAFNKLEATVSSLVFEIGASLADEVLSFAEGARTVIKTVRDWIKENTGLVKTAAAVGVSLVALGGIVTGVGAALIAAGFAATGLAAIVGGITSAFAALASPIGVVTGLLLGGVVAWMKWADSGKKTTAYFKLLFRDMGDTARSTWKGIVDAISSGDLALAAEVAVAGMMVAWQQATADVKQLWTNTKNQFLTDWNGASGGLAKLFISALGTMETAWIGTVGLMKTGWNTLADIIAKSFSAWTAFTEFFAINFLEKTRVIPKVAADLLRDTVKNDLQKRNKQIDADTAAKQAGVKSDTAKNIIDVDAKTSARQKALAEDQKRQQDKLDAELLTATGARRKALEDAKQRLLDAQAKAAAAAARRKAPDVGDLQLPGFGTGKASTSTTKNIVTLSAASAVAAGYQGSSGSMQKRMADDIGDIKKLTADQIAKTKQLIALGQGIAAGLVFGG